MDRVNHVIFPLSLTTETIEILKMKGAMFRRPADLWPSAARLRSRLDYEMEFAGWKAGSTRWYRKWPLLAARMYQRVWRSARIPRLLGAAGVPEVFLQHDADRNPENTITVMQAERALGVASACYFFRHRASRWPGDTERYELDVATLQLLEAKGFEIGYHLNGPELEDYDDERGWGRIRADVAFFRERFSLRSFVSHGGRPGPAGRNNDHIVHADCLSDQIWFYNGKGVVTDVSWSDGELECAASRSLQDPREVARGLTGRMRARFLFRPQYYGSTLRTKLGGVGVVETDWWQQLWREKTTTVC